MNILKFIGLALAMALIETFIPFGHWINMCVVAVSLYKLVSDD